MIELHSNSADAAAIAAHYDELDPFYRAVWGTHLHHGYWRSGRESVDEAVLALSRLVATRAGITSDSRVCDFGCGYGETARFLVDAYNASVTGITVSRRQHDYAVGQLNGGAEPQFMLADGIPTILSEQNFDALIAIESTEHVRDKASFFQEARRVLRKDGRLAVVAWLACDGPRLWEKKLLLQPICAEGRLASLATATEYMEMINAAGFRDSGFDDLTTSVAKTWSVCAYRLIKNFCIDSGFRNGIFQLDRAHSAFALTVFRIWLAYRTGSMRYGLFTALK
jgi:tocopherol O-methyltransferase